MKVTLITGASGGIGEAFARRLAAEKHNLMLVARSEDTLARLAGELEAKHGIKAHFIALDLTDENSYETLFAETERLGLKIDWLINNAGFGSGGDFADLDLDRELGMIKLNISALIALTHRYLHQMRERKSGTIINLSSAAAFQPIPFMATYAASKAFVNSFSEAIAEENRPFNIQVLALCPGSTKTNFHAAAKIDRSIQIKGQQTVDDVIETAMKAVGTRKSKVISGWANYITAIGATVMPNALSSRIIGKAMRTKYQKEL